MESKQKIKNRHKHHHKCHKHKKCSSTGSETTESLSPIVPIGPSSFSCLLPFSSGFISEEDIAKYIGPELNIVMGFGSRNVINVDDTIWLNHYSIMIPKDGILHDFQANIGIYFNGLLESHIAIPAPNGIENFNFLHHLDFKFIVLKEVPNTALGLANNYISSALTVPFQLIPTPDNAGKNLNICKASNANIPVSACENIVVKVIISSPKDLKKYITKIGFNASLIYTATGA